MKKIILWIKSKTRRNLIFQLNQILQFSRDEKEYTSRPNTCKAADFWMREWYGKCKEIDTMINQKGGRRLWK